MENKKILIGVLVVVLMIGGCACNSDDDCINTCCGCIHAKEECDIRCLILPDRECMCSNGECLEKTSKQQVTITTEKTDDKQEEEIIEKEVTTADKKYCEQDGECVAIGCLNDLDDEECYLASDSPIVNSIYYSETAVLINCVTCPIREGVECVGNTCVLSKKVTITTDKTKYDQGDTIKITLNNNFDSSLCFDPCNDFYFEKENMDGEFDEECPRPLCGINLEINTEDCLESGGKRNFELRMDLSAYKKEPGTYRAVFPLCIDCEDDEYFETDKKFYSNEFTIK